jgi:hypothetical protein
MSENRASYARRVKRAAHLLLYRRHRQPGAKGWELKKYLGKNFPQVLDLLDQQFDPLGLQIQTVYEGEVNPENPSSEQMDRARYYATIKGPLSPSELVMSGWRVDNVAVLVVTVAYIISQQGKASRRELEQILNEKFPKTRIERSLNRFIRQGYINQDEDVLYLDWRARAEIDQKALIKLVLGSQSGILSDQPKPDTPATE